MALIIITDKPGLTGNQLWAFINQIAIARSLNKKVIITLEDPFFKFFKKPELKGVIIITQNSFFLKPWHYFLRFLRYHYSRAGWAAIFRLLKLKYTEGLIEEKEFYNAINKRGVFFLESWPNRVYRNLETLQESEIRTCFKFKEEVTSKVDKIIGIIRSQFDIVTGVHIRRGDYKYFLSGQYYYPDEVYLDKIEQMKLLLLGKKVAFLLCSNEALSEPLLAYENVFQIENAKGEEDMYALSCSDFIIGPLSTFSMWAAYIAEKPLKFIERKDEKLLLSNFKKVLAQDVYIDFDKNLYET